MELPFEITRNGNGAASGSNGRMVVTSEVNGGTMFRRRGSKAGRGPTEMLVVETGDGVRVYVRQLDNGFVQIAVTRREIYA